VEAREKGGHDLRLVVSQDGAEVPPQPDEGLERLLAASLCHLDGVRRHFSTVLADDEAEIVAAFLARLHDSLRACAPVGR